MTRRVLLGYLKVGVDPPRRQVFGFLFALIFCLDIGTIKTECRHQSSDLFSQVSTLQLTRDCMPVQSIIRYPRLTRTNQQLLSVLFEIPIPKQPDCVAYQLYLIRAVPPPRSKSPSLLASTRGKPTLSSFWGSSGQLVPKARLDEEKLPDAQSCNC
jgi:hypothetical protein